jgi:eukaryotic-like serine/threonine-protein kinase
MTDARWQQISRLYNDAAMLPPDARAQFLRDACGPDQELRAEVESLLADDIRANDVLEAGAVHMSLIGQRIGVYEVTALLGVGGMGEVYRARDTKLRRDVAIKVLPAEFSRDKDRLSRFEREALLLASLNHPHIAAIHGVEDSRGMLALVLELVEGETLADRIARGPVPCRDALAIARQIAEALEAAHDKGVIHRDLKPANISITPDGAVKVLDFGLAKAALDGARNVDATQSGIILGTAAYMSPEQARGQHVDKRTDIWAFGCVLYEMLTGTPAFTGETVSDTLAATLEREPDWTALPSTTPPLMKHLIEHCLQKDPRQRLREIADARPHLLEAGVSSRPTITNTRARRWPLSLVAAGVVGGIVASTFVWQAARRSPPRNTL